MSKGHYSFAMLLRYRRPRKTVATSFQSFSRLAKLLSDNAQSGEYIYWYCYDYSGQCTPGGLAYSWDSRGIFWSNHYTVFCDLSYGRSTMDDLLAKYQDNEYKQKVMEKFHISTGQMMLHEIWHYEELVSSPRTSDDAYQALDVWNLAKDRGTSWAYVNADSHALDAIAIYVQQYFKSSMSPVSWRKLHEFDAAAAYAVLEPPSDDAVVKTFNQTPPGWNGPLVLDDQPDLSFWTKLNLYLQRQIKTHAMVSVAIIGSCPATLRCKMSTTSVARPSRPRTITSDP